MQPGNDPQPVQFQPLFPKTRSEFRMHFLPSFSFNSGSVTLVRNYAQALCDN